ncbi:hypothetical protein KI387_034484, partial [Taxus chinensis]
NSLGVVFSMARDTIDEVPMLSNSQLQRSSEVEVEVLSFPTRSASMSLHAMGGIRRQEQENKVIPFSGPIRNEGKRNTFIPMSGPLPMVRASEGTSMSALLRTVGKAEGTGTNSRGAASLSGGGHGMNDNRGKKHEHLLKSGPLGRCNDPFCTTCPSYYVKNTKKPQLRPAFDYE